MPIKVSKRHIVSHNMLGDELRRLMPEDARKAALDRLADNFARIITKKVEKAARLDDDDTFLTNQHVRNLMAAFAMLSHLSEGSDEYEVCIRTVRAIIRAYEELSSLMIRNGLDMDYRVLDAAIDANEAIFRSTDKESLLEQLRAIPASLEKGT